jgi:spore coat polysaccharide biosynthesis predicted glycosyltransferase SpsG
MKITIKEVNAITGEEVISDRNETNEEKIERLAFEAYAVEMQAQKESKELARQAILERLGISADEAALLLG